MHAQTAVPCAPDDVGCGSLTATATLKPVSKERLHPAFAVISDERFEFTAALGLSPFVADGMRFVRRSTLIVRGNRIEAVFYLSSSAERPARLEPCVGKGSVEEPHEGFDLRAGEAPRCVESPEFHRMIGGRRPAYQPARRQVVGHEQAG